MGCLFLKVFFNLKSIKTKLLLGFFIVIFLVLILTSYYLYSVFLTNKNTKDIIDQELELVLVSNQLAYNVSERLALVRGYILFDDIEYRKQFNTLTGQSKELEKQILQLDHSEEVKHLLKLSQEWEETIVNDVFARISAQNRETALEILAEKVEPLSDELTTSFKQLSTEQEKSIYKKGQGIIKHGQFMTLLSFSISLIVIVFSFFISIFLARHITKAIRKVMKRMKAIASGDLSAQPIETRLKDETGQLITATNDMMLQMRSLLMNIKTVLEIVTIQSGNLTQSANEVKMGSEQTSTTMQELASGAEEQATRTQELETMMNNFYTKVMEAYQNGEQIEHASMKVHEITNEGKQYISLSANQMENINGIVKQSVQKIQALDIESQKISKLVSVIKEIAEQTNLLALNAAIEAARAGEHGKGFAVVAEEVRKLAEGVSASVKDITSIVKNIQTEVGNVTATLQLGYKEVEQGNVQMKMTQEKFSDINDSINVTVKNIKSITGHLLEIVEESGEIQKSIEGISAISEEAAAGIEQTSAASQQTTSSMEVVTESANELSKLADKLNHLIQKFKL